jgi:hypothetical protein
MSGHARLACETLADPAGIEVVDRVEQLRYQLHTPEPVSPTQVPADEFYFPVGTGVRVRSREFVLPSVVSVFVRDDSGGIVREIEHLESASLSEGSYILELSTQIKTYVEVDGPVEITADLLQVRFSFPEPQEIDVGVRSRHTRPAATITTTADPVDLMTAVGAFGSALKTTSPERSFPTLRGHPPAVELGSSLDVPASVEPPETGVRLEAPPVCDAVFPLASLSYYLGADVVPAEQPRLVTDTGFEYAFDYPEGYEDDVERVLKQLFLLDCLARTEGFYGVTLRERSALEDHLALDWGRLYDQPLAERVASYLSVPYAALENQVPAWRLTAHVEPTAETVTQLPFVVDDLAVVRTVDTEQWECSAPSATAPSGAGGLTRSAAGSSNGAVSRSVSSATRRADRTYVEFEAADSLEQAWLGEGVPVGASKLLPAAFRNRLDREVTSDDIAITIVLNDARMAEERDLVDGAYGDREHLPFNVTVRRDLTAEQLQAELRKDRSFLHYIGHTDEDGFECANGKLDVDALDGAGIDAFLLNACRSYRQGVGLIEAGAMGGIVTLSEVFNGGAVRMGETIARLLNAGFPLHAALEIAREESVLGGQYIVVGDGGMTVAQPASRVPFFPDISPDGDGYSLAVQTYITDNAGIGSMSKPYLEQAEEFFLSSGTRASYHVTTAELEQFLELEEMPVRFREELQWSSTVCDRL